MGAFAQDRLFLCSLWKVCYKRFPSRQTSYVVGDWTWDKKAAAQPELRERFAAVFGRPPAGELGDWLEWFHQEIVKFRRSSSAVTVPARVSTSRIVG